MPVLVATATSSLFRLSSGILYLPVITFALAAFLYLLAEFLVAPILFRLIRKRFGRTESDDVPPETIKAAKFKGRFERAVLLLGLLGSYAHVLTLFGALKIATRIKEDPDEVSNDYFLIGNLTSVALVLGINQIAGFLAMFLFTWIRKLPSTTTSAATGVALVVFFVIAACSALAVRVLLSKKNAPKEQK